MDPYVLFLVLTRDSLVSYLKLVLALIIFWREKGQTTMMAKKSLLTLDQHLSTENIFVSISGIIGKPRPFRVLSSFRAFNPPALICLIVVQFLSCGAQVLVRQRWPRSWPS